MPFISELRAKLTVDNLKQVTWDIKKQFKSAGDSIDKNVTKKTTQWANTIGGAFAKLKNTIAWVFAVGAIVAFTKRLLKLWSDITEFQSKFDTVFKWVEDQATETFQTMADAVGRSNVELVKFAGTVGDTLKPLGFASSEALSLSENMIKLAIDVASFNNVSDEQAINAFTKALTGEREALKSLGIVINETDVKNKAYALWLADTGQELSKQAKALATYQLLLDNTTDAQGDAIRTADSFANQLKRLQGVISDTMANAGRDIAQETAGILERISNFVGQYWPVIFKLLVEIGRAIWDFFKSIWGIISDTVTALWGDLGTGQEQVTTFWNVIVTVLQSISLGIRGIWLILRNFVRLVIAVQKDQVQAWQWWFQVIWDLFRWFGQLVTGVMKAVGNNIIAGIQEWVNWAINNINNAVQKLEKLVGRDLFWDIWAVGTREFQSLQDVASEAFWALRESSADFADSFWENTAEAFDKAKDDFFDLWAYVITTQDDIARETAFGAQKIWDSYSTAFATAGDLMTQFGDLSADATEKTSKWASKWADDMKLLEDAIKDAEDQLDDYQKSVEDAQEAQEKYAKGQTEYFRDLKQQIREVNDELQKNQQAFATEQQRDLQSFIRNEVETELDLQEKIAEVEKDIASEKQKALDDWASKTERQIELSQELLDLQNELAQVQENISSVSTGWLIDIQAERDRARLTDAQRRKLEYNEEQTLAEDAFKKEQERLDRRRKILWLFQSYQFDSVQQLEDLKNDKRLEEYSLEEQQLIQKLANERLELLQLRDDKIEMEREVASASIKLQNQVYTIASQNLANLDAKYQLLINKINSAIQAQQRLDSIKVSQRYQWWPVTAGNPYLVWENPDWSPNATTELFVPNVSGSIVPASKLQSVLRQVQQNSVDNSRKYDIGTVNVNQKVDMELFFERLLWRS